MTVVKAKLMRLGLDKPQPTTEVIESKIPNIQASDYEDIPNDNESEDSQDSQTSSPITIFPIPDNLRKITELLALIKNYPGDISITIGKKEALVSEE